MSEKPVVSQANDDESRQERMYACQQVFRTAIAGVINAKIASPAEAASAMSAVGIMTGFVAADHDGAEVGTINACVAEVADLVNRRIVEWLARKQAGAAAKQAGGDHGG